MPAKKQRTSDRTTKDAVHVFVNDRLQTSVPNIYAAGDVAAHVSSDGICRKTTTWAAAIEQGIIAAHAMTGADKRYEYKPAVIATEICGIGLRICGQFQEEIEIISYQDITLFVAYDNRHRAQAVLVMSERVAVGRQFPRPHVLIGKTKMKS